MLYGEKKHEKMWDIETVKEMLDEWHLEGPEECPERAHEQSNVN